MKRKICLLLLLPLIGLSSCNNDDNSRKAPVDQLPQPTQSGEYTFGCLVNGKPMIPNNTMYMSAIYQGGGLQILTEEQKNNKTQGMTIVILDPININERHDLSNFPRNGVNYSKSGNNSSLCYYEYEDTFQGWIKFSKIDRINYIVSGTFEYSTVN